jgi:hypothetical protein
LEALPARLTQPAHKIFLDQIRESFDDLRRDDAVAKLDELSALLTADMDNDGQ